MALLNWSKPVETLFTCDGWPPTDRVRVVSVGPAGVAVNVIDMLHAEPTRIVLDDDQIARLAGALMYAMELHRGMRTVEAVRAALKASPTFNAEA